jgi:hypothetical protein
MQTTQLFGFACGWIDYQRPHLRVVRQSETSLNTKNSERADQAQEYIFTRFFFLS